MRVKSIKVVLVGPSWVTRSVFWYKIYWWEPIDICMDQDTRCKEKWYENGASKCEFSGGIWQFFLTLPISRSGTQAFAMLSTPHTVIRRKMWSSPGYSSRDSFTMEPVDCGLFPATGQRKYTKCWWYCLGEQMWEPCCGWLCTAAALKEGNFSIMEVGPNFALEMPIKKVRQGLGLNEEHINHRIVLARGTYSSTVD